MLPVPHIESTGHGLRLLSPGQTLFAGQSMHLVGSVLLCNSGFELYPGPHMHPSTRSTVVLGIRTLPKAVDWRRADTRPEGQSFARAGAKMAATRETPAITLSDTLVLPTCEAQPSNHAEESSCDEARTG